MELNSSEKLRIPSSSESLWLDTSSEAEGRGHWTGVLRGRQSSLTQPGAGMWAVSRPTPGRAETPHAITVHGAGPAVLPLSVHRRGPSVLPGGIPSTMRLPPGVQQGGCPAHPWCWPERGVGSPGTLNVNCLSASGRVKTEGKVLRRIQTLCKYPFVKNGQIFGTLITF